MKFPRIDLKTQSMEGCAAITEKAKRNQTEQGEKWGAINVTSTATNFWAHSFFALMQQGGNNTIAEF